jgi:hypothetical protein
MATKIKKGDLIFRIAKSSKEGDFFMVGEKYKVSEQEFWDKVGVKVKELTESKPDKYEETFEKAKNYLLTSRESLTINDTWFEIRIGRVKK